MPYQTQKKTFSLRNLDLFYYQKQLSGLKCAAFGSMLYRLSVLQGPFSRRVSKLLKCHAESLYLHHHHPCVVETTQLWQMLPILADLGTVLKSHSYRLMLKIT